MKALSLSLFLCVALLPLLAGCAKSTPDNQSTAKADQQRNEKKQESDDGKDSSQDNDQTVPPVKQEGQTADSKTQESKSQEKGKTQSDVKTLTPEEQASLAEKELEKINTEFAETVVAFNAEIEKLKTEEAKKELFEKNNPEKAYTRKLFALVKKYPQTDAAFTAGMTIILEYPTNEEFPSSMDLILDHHGSRVEWHKIAEGYLQLVPSQQIEDWMRKMIATAANAEVKVQMTYLLYRYFDQFPTFATTIEYNPQVKQRFSKEQIDYIFMRKKAVRKDMLATLKELKEKHPEVNAQGNRKLKDVIDGPIFELEHLQVGSIAPEIEGADFDGVEFRLSDYRGKVVMLDFWGQWCPPCRAMFPHERELIEQLVGKPFVLIGVNSDRRLETAIRATKDQNLVWRNFWCGPQGTRGPIAKKWNVSAWPTVYLIDGDGVIRYKEVLGTKIDEGIQTLLTEMGHPTSLVKNESKAKQQLVYQLDIQPGHSKDLRNVLVRSE